MDKSKIPKQQSEPAKVAPKGTQLGNPVPVQPNNTKTPQQDVTTRFHVSAAKGDISIVKEILQSAKLTPEDRQQLVEHKDPGNYNRTVIIQAARNGHLGVVEFLAREMNADLFARDSHELSSMAVHFAAEAGHLEVVRFLTDFNEQLVEAKDKYESTPLNLAAFAGKLKVVEFLVDVKKANIENKGAFKRTPLLSAAEQGHLSVVEFLFNRGAVVDAKSSAEGHEDMAIHLAAYFGHLGVVDFLLKLNPNFLEAKNLTKETALNRAAMGNQVKLVQHLVEEKKADLENRGEFGRTPLLQAADEGHHTVFEVLLQLGANLLAKDSHNEDTVLHLAAYFNHTAVVSFLLEYDGADTLVKTKNRQGLTPLALAKQQNKTDIVALFQEKGIRG